jgi:hypothetical protein
MPAVLVTATDKDLFQSGGTVDHLIAIPAVDSLIGEEHLALYNTVGLRLNETIQYFLTFDDVIKSIHFGKGLGSIAVEGTMFCTKTGDVPGLNQFSSQFGALRGKVEQLTIGDTAFTVMVTEAQLQLSGDPDTIANFSFNFAVLDHNL